MEAAFYKYSVKDEESLPFTVSVWTAKGAGGHLTLTLEVELNEESDIQYPGFENLVVTVPLNDKPKVT